MATNDFIGFASSGAANVMSQADYAAAHEQLVGVQPGMASSAMANKVWRQGANMASVIGQLIKNHGIDALDNGDLATLYNALLSATASTTLAGLMSAADKAKLDGLISTLATQSAAGYMSATDKTALDNAYPNTGGKLEGYIWLKQNGLKAYSNIAVQNASIKKGTAPDGTRYFNLGFYGEDISSADDRLGLFEVAYSTSKRVSTYMSAFKAGSSSDTEEASISVSYDPDGTILTYAPKPPQDDNNNQIATTSWHKSYETITPTKVTANLDANKTSSITVIKSGGRCFYYGIFFLASAPSGWTSVTLCQNMPIPLGTNTLFRGAVVQANGYRDGFVDVNTSGDLQLRVKQIPYVTGWDIFVWGVYPCL